MRPRMNANAQPALCFNSCLFVCICGLLAAVVVTAQAPILGFTATTANVSGAPDSIRIDVLRWSTDAERDQLFSAWTQPGATGAGGRGASGRGRGPAPLDPDDPALAGVN